MGKGGKSDGPIKRGSCLDKLRSIGKLFLSQLQQIANAKADTLAKDSIMLDEFMFDL